MKVFLRFWQDGKTVTLESDVVTIVKGQKYFVDIDNSGTEEIQMLDVFCADGVFTDIVDVEVV